MAFTHGGARHSDKAWTDDEVTILLDLWRRGKSASDIAMTFSNGRSRNSIIAKIRDARGPIAAAAKAAHSANMPIWRAKPASRAAPAPKRKPIPDYEVVGFQKRTGKPEVAEAAARPSPKAEPESQPEPVARIIAPPPPPARKCEPVTLMELAPHQCRFPFGQTDFRFCAAPKDPRAPYCINHMSLTHTTAGLRKLYAAT